jgi:hypothetical protein
MPSKAKVIDFSLVRVNLKRRGWTLKRAIGASVIYPPLTGKVRKVAKGRIKKSVGKPVRKEAS